MAYIKLEQGDYRHIPRGNVVDTGTLGPCVGVIIHDKIKKEAYAGHFVESEADGLEDMVTEALDRFNPVKQLEVYVAGNSVMDNSDPELREYELEDRILVPQLLKKYGFKKSGTHIIWSPNSPYHHISISANLWLDVDTAKNELQIVSYTLEFCFKGASISQRDILYKGDIRKAPYLEMV